MRLLSICLLLITFFSFLEPAQAGETVKKEKVIEMMRVSGAASVFDDMIKTIVPSIINELHTKDPSLDPKHGQEIAQIMVDEAIASKDEFFNQLIPLYQGIFTAEEIQASIDYYSSAAGQSIMKKMPQLMQGSMQIGQAFANRIGAKMAEKAAARARKLGYKI